MKRAKVFFFVLILWLASCDNPMFRKPPRANVDSLIADQLSQMVDSLIRTRDTAKIGGVLRRLDSVRYQGYANPDSFRRELDKMAAQMKLEREIRLRDVLSRINVYNDAVDGVTIYRPKGAPEFVNIPGTHVFPYIAIAGSTKALNVKYQYCGKDWLFVQGFVAWADGRRFVIDPGLEKSKNNRGDRVWEWSDLTSDSGQIAMLKAVSQADSAIIRFQGQDYRQVDHLISPKGKQAMRDILELWELL